MKHSKRKNQNIIELSMKKTLAVKIVPYVPYTIIYALVLYVLRGIGRVRCAGRVSDGLAKLVIYILFIFSDVSIWLTFPSGGVSSSPLPPSRHRVVLTFFYFYFIFTDRTFTVTPPPPGVMPRRRMTKRACTILHPTRYIRYNKVHDRTRSVWNICIPFRLTNSSFLAH